MPRKSAPGVKDGRVLSKQNRALTPNFFDGTETDFVVAREKPGPGYRHLLGKQDIHGFISLMPDWKELSEGLYAIVLAPGERDTCGWHSRGVIGICAWERKLWQVWNPDFYHEHARLLERLGVPIARRSGMYECQFTESTARAYQLLHVFLHELGHHQDRMTTRTKRDCGRGETFAESYAWAREGDLFQKYERKFGF